MRNYLFIIFIFLLIGCQQALEDDPDPLNVKAAKDKHVSMSTKEMEEEVTITVGAIGDVLLHERVYDLAVTDAGYDFMPMLKPVQVLLEAPDFMMANQESMPGGVEIGLSTYPAFNSPQEIVRNLQALGIDMVVGANNHTIDRGPQAVMSALDFYDEIQMEYVGVYRDREDRKRDRIVSVNDVTIGILAYTYGTNGIALPVGHEDIVALIDKERMKSDVERLREKVDVVIVHMHWGAEYEREPNQEQRQLAQLLSEAGADIIFGHHPHVLQPIDVIKQESGHETTVFYSLGNFLSGQDFNYTDVGGVATIDITKNIRGDQTVQIHSPEIEPTIVVKEENLYKVYPFSEIETPAISGSSFEEIKSHTKKYVQ
ncbi:CapA family protein [Halalkalibacter krulwichiae]|uniref:Capsule biosynthesis protein CapA n=1 Tax=Halalkalibacter krulwichiae TaxID=199441 RepID=A0A1X9MGS3_9BACI|nr:CapA family protein [Halalkalibacter krulwichiae]ARK32665.1 Capsule biosynthesis protein CapA [Halalkalibacter krulwichiae]